MSTAQGVFDVIVAIVTGVALWLFLPRGVVLTRTLANEPHPHLAIWHVHNASALPVRILSATVEAIDTYDETTKRFHAIDVSKYDPEMMARADPSAQSAGNERPASWRGEVIDPGERLIVGVHDNANVTIRYRRAGWPGIFERRAIQITPVH